MIAQTTSPATSTTSTTPATPTTRAAVSRLEVAAILLLMAGEGYINGNFIQPINVGWGAFIDLVHLIPLAALLWLGIALLRPVDAAGEAQARRRGLRVGVTILAAYTILGCLVMIALGTFLPTIGVGVQAFSDWLAVILAGGGAVLWFVSIFIARRA